MVANEHMVENRELEVKQICRALYSSLNNRHVAGERVGALTTLHNRASNRSLHFSSVSYEEARGNGFCNLDSVVVYVYF